MDKKHIFLTFICCISIMFSFFIPVYASDPVYSQIPEPVPDDFHYYYANERALYCAVFTPAVSLNTLRNEVVYDPQSGSYLDGYESYQPFKFEADAVLNPNNDTYTLSFKAYNYTLRPVTVSFFVYYHHNGALQYTVTQNIPAASTSLNTSGNNTVLDIHPGSYTLVSQYTLYDNYMPFNSFIGSILQFTIRPRLSNIVWNQGTDIHNDFTTITTYLNTLNTSIQSIVSQDQQYYSVIQQFIDDFFYDDNTSGSAVLFNFRDIISNLGQVHEQIFNLAREFNEWYYYQFGPYTVEELEILQGILDALTVNEESQPDMENQTEMASAVDEYQSAEGQIMDEANSYIDNIDDVIGGFDSQLNDNSIRGAFQFFSFIFTNFIQGQFSIFILIPCIFGLICLVLGRHVQRG